jgi:hypothetical protein
MLWLFLKPKTSKAARGIEIVNISSVEVENVMPGFDRFWTRL